MIHSPDGPRTVVKEVIASFGGGRDAMAAEMRFGLVREKPLPEFPYRGVSGDSAD